MANEALLKSDLIEILSTTFELSNLNRDLSYKELLTQFNETINGCMDGINNSEYKPDEKLLCRLVPHYVQIDATAAGHYLVRAIDNDFNDLSLTLIQHGADLTANTLYQETPHSMAFKKGKTDMVKAIEQKIESGVTQSLRKLSLNSNSSSTAPTTSTTADTSTTVDCCKIMP